MRGEASDSGPSGSAPRKRRGVSLSSRLAATLLGVGFVSLIAATLVGVNAGQTLGRGIVEDSLQALRSSGSLDVSSQLAYYERLAEQYAASPQTVAAIDGFSAALEELDPVPASDLRGYQEELIEDYQTRYFAPLLERGDTVQVTDILSIYPPALYLQATYSVPEEPITDAISVTDAGDGSDWSALHAMVHRVYRTAVTQGALRDIYLIDAASERIVYTAAKGPDLGTSVEVGPYSGSIIARAADAALDSEDGIVTDLSFYRGVPGVPIGASAAAVREDGRVVGAVVLTYDADVFTDRLSSLVAATAGDLAEDAVRDLYLIGTDGTTRSDPQAYSADPEAFLDAASATGVLSDQGRAAIELNGTTILVLPADEATVNAAVEGNGDVFDGTSVTGGQVVAAVEQVPNDDIVWYTAADVGIATANTTIADFRRILLFGASAFVVALAFGAVALAKNFMRPIRVISDRLGRSAVAHAKSASPGPVTIPDSSPVEFHRLADSISSMEESLSLQQHELRDARSERLGVLEKMLPAAIAQRIARGDVESLDEVPSATVVVVVVLGLGALVEAHRGGDRRLIDELHAELDGIAFEHGLDRIKVVGDSYFAACGHDRPFIDHAPRSVAFAQAVAEAVRHQARASSVALDTATGINTGPVLVGMSGGSRLVYDVWGPTVTTAHTLARFAHAGDIVMAQATRARLPEEVDVVRWDAGPSATAERGAGGPVGDLWSMGDPVTQPASSGSGEV